MENIRPVQRCRSLAASLPFRLALMSFLLNLAIESSAVFLPLYAQSIGSSNLQVGIIAAVYGIAFFLSSLFFGRQSDVRGRLVFIRWGLGLSAIAYLTQILARSAVMLVLSRASIGFSMGITSAVIMAYTYENQKEVGKFVSYGALGWSFGAVVAAAVRDYEPLFAASAVASAFAFGISFTLREKPTTRVQAAIFSLPIPKENRRIYFTFFVRQLGAHAIWAIFPLYLSGIGASKLWIAVIDGINMGGQFIAMRFIERFDAAKAYRAGLFLSIIVFGIYSLATSYLQILPVQALLSVGWSCMFVGAFSYLLQRSVERGTVSGQLYSTMYLSAGIGPFAGGAVSQAWGLRTVMYLGSVLALVSFLFSRGLDNRKEARADRMKR